MSALEMDKRQDEYVRHFVLEVTQSLVDDGEHITIDIAAGETFSTLKVRASPAAIFVLIGSKGQMARALRTILAGSGAKMGRRYSLDLCEE